LWREFEKARSRILASLFDAISGALGAVESVRLEGMPRMADFAVWATAAESALGWEPGAFMEAYAGNRAEATESALEADPVAIAVRQFMEDQDEWTGTAGELWEALNELVGEAIKHTKAWPGAPNALSARLKRLAPALRGIGIEYEDARLPGGERKRAKRLRKNNAAKDRFYRPDRPADQENPAKPQNQPGTMIADAGRSRDDDAEKTVPEETPAKEHVRDDRDGRDDDLRTDSNLLAFLREPPAWYRRQADECVRRGTPERLLKPLASTVAYHVLGDTRRSAELLPYIEADLKERGGNVSAERIRNRNERILTESQENHDHALRTLTTRILDDSNSS
jgi:hypothetical protein